MQSHHFSAKNQKLHTSGENRHTGKCGCHLALWDIAGAHQFKANQAPEVSSCCAWFLQMKDQAILLLHSMVKKKKL